MSEVDPKAAESLDLDELDEVSGGLQITYVLNKNRSIRGWYRCPNCGGDDLQLFAPGGALLGDFGGEFDIREHDKHLEENEIRCKSCTLCGPGKMFSLGYE